MALGGTKLRSVNREAFPAAALTGGRRSPLARLLLCALLSALVVPCLLALAAPAAAEDKTPDDLSHIVNPPKIDQNAPMLLQADEMVYDNENNRVSAKGHVEIYYGDYTLLADKVTYDRNNNTLDAEGNVRIKDPSGAVITSNEITLTDDFRDGFIEALKVVTKEDTRIVANTASREAGNVTVFHDGWFTPCKPCVEHPERPPTWRIRAKDITHKKDQASITFKDATFDLFGVPIAWVPYFKTADPTVKRKSGFLMPSYSHSNDLGTTVTVPYYFALSDTYDFTFSPMYTEKQNTLLVGDWRQRFANGGYHVELAGVYDEDYSDDTSRNFRGSIKSAGRFALDPYWSWGWDILAESDDTFRRFYKLDSNLKTDRVSQVYLEGLRDRNYASMRFYQTDGLVYYDDSESDATVLPIIDYDYIVNDPILGGELSFNSNAMSLTRNDGPDSSRVITEMRWRRQMVDGIGEVFTPFATARGDLYNVEDYSVDDGGIARGTAAAGAEYRYPFVSRMAGLTSVVEPIGQVIFRPNSIGDQNDIPNEDANSLVFDDTILFDIDKFSGYDRVETGSTANVGLRYTGQLDTGQSLRAVFGESYHLAGENSFYEGTGLNTDRSDYVAGIYVQAARNLSLTAQGRFDEKTFERRRTDIGANTNYGPITLGVNYADVPAEAGYFDEDREEVRTDGALALTDRWALLGRLRYDLAKELTLQDGVGLRYQDDCFTFALTYLRSNFHDYDIEPDERIIAQFSLKYLGDYAFTSDASSLDAEN